VTAVDRELEADTQHDAWVRFRRARAKRIEALAAADESLSAARRQVASTENRVQQLVKHAQDRANTRLADARAELESVDVFAALLTTLPPPAKVAAGLGLGALEAQAKSADQRSFESLSNLRVHTQTLREHRRKFKQIWTVAIIIAVVLLWLLIAALAGRQ
jgi:hypothetical protein